MVNVNKIYKKLISFVVIKKLPKRKSNEMY